ncbi:MAG: methyltransferase domain-containing protein [Planctomycetota bacterium]
MTMPSDGSGVRRQYHRTELLERICAGVSAAGGDPEALTIEQLGPVDHFHLGGGEETARLIGLAGFRSSMRVLDVGGGIGGPARMLAARVGCDVTVLDLCDDYCAVGAELTRRTGLGERVRFRAASALAMPFADRAFTGAWSQHSSMNIEDKAALYREVHRVLEPGARFALHEVVAGPAGPVHFPVPWANDPAISFLCPQAEVRELIAAAGFREILWQDVTTRTRDWLAARIAAGKAAASAGKPPALGIHLVIGPDAPVKFANMLRNIDEGRQEIVQAVFES